MNNIENSFENAVFAVVLAIPYGRATSYGAIARAIGCSHMSRKVGNVLGKCNSIKIPAHRVLNSQGMLTGKAAFGNYDEMQKLLESEGVTVVNDKIKNWKNIFWNPLNEIQV